jgi:hypothetical protein
MPRRPRTPASYARRGPQREPYDVVLIVCEGAKTEPFYFEGLRRAWRLSSANIHVRSAGYSDPPNLVAHALEALRNGDYDRAFCVFDRDSHAGFDQALAQIAQSPEGHAGRLDAVVSWPCFEIWILLHFVMTTKAFVAGGGRSPCEQVIREISGHLADYAKGSKSVFDALADKLATALTHADRLNAHNLETGSDNPGTAVHSLVNYLKSLKPQ